MADWQEDSETKSETVLEMSVQRQRGARWAQTPKVFEDSIRTLMGRSSSIAVIDCTALAPSRSYVHLPRSYLDSRDRHACERTHTPVNF